MQFLLVTKILNASFSSIRIQLSLSANYSLGGSQDLSAQKAKDEVKRPKRPPAKSWSLEVEGP